jgi:hypothetical protein
VTFEVHTAENSCLPGCDTVTGQTVTDVSYARWSFKSRELMTQWHSVTSPETGIFNLQYPKMHRLYSFRSIRHTATVSSSIPNLKTTNSCLTTDPPKLLTETRSIPRSSWHSMAKKSPTVLLIGRRVNRQRSRRDGSGTVTWGRPLKYSTVTSVRARHVLN